MGHFWDDLSSQSREWHTPQVETATNLQHNKHPIGCEAQLFENAYIHTCFFRQAIFALKVGQTHLVFGV